MKRISRTIAALSLVLVVLLSSLTVVSAEVTQVKADTDEKTDIIITEDNGSKAYELVWKYAIIGEHLYRRRWNATLGGWYDPEWILVY